MRSGWITRCLAGFNRRGLRQGDHLSPYLFVLCAQGLFTMIHGFAQCKLFAGLQIAHHSPMTSHLFFTDDNLVFFRATMSDCDNVKLCLSRYEFSSGQMVNYDKSDVSFSKNTPVSMHHQIKAALGTRICQGHDIYLGLPTFSLREKRV